MADDAGGRLVAVAGALVNALIVAPIEAGVKLVTDPDAAAARTRQELSNARFLGEMAVTQGLAELRDRTRATDESNTAIVDTPIVEPEPALAVVPDRADVSETSDPEGTADVLPLPDYDQLPAIDIVAQLDGLDADELAAVDAYERANRRRRTVLGKITQLTAP